MMKCNFLSTYIRVATEVMIVSKYINREPKKIFQKQTHMINMVKE
jgi:hypothetical protein